MIDTHAHLFDTDFDADITDVLKCSKESGIEFIIMPAIEPKTFNKMLSLAESNEMLFCSIGIHPHNSLEVNDETLALIEKLANHPKVKAIGEIGLDYYYDFAPKEIQISAFKSQIELAKKFNLPIIVHNRDSNDDLIRILTEMQDGTLEGVLHCFSGDDQMMKKAIELGFHVSFTGNITFKKADELRKVVLETPMEKILLETDSPWMSPVPFRGKRNEPKNVRLVAEKISEIKSITIEKVIEMTTNSAKKLFRLAIMLIILITFMNLNQLYSQTQEFDEELDSLVEGHDPYCKWIGIAPIIGTNTVVNTFKPNGEDRSQDGLFTLGFGLFSSPVEWLFLEFAYLHFEDKTPFENTKNQTEVDPLDIEQHNMYELGGGIILNPHGRVNFYGVSGYSFQTTKNSMYYETDNDTYAKRKLENSRNGLFFGLGFFANLPMKKAGTLVFNAEWRLNFILENTILDYDPRFDFRSPEYIRRTEYSTFFSIPRLSIIWYPPLDEWFQKKK